MNIQLRTLGAILVAAVLTSAGCGGGGGGGSVSPPPPASPPPSGGIIRSGAAVGTGPITAFGSVWVNGVEYNTDTADFFRDDNPSSEVEFEVGETVIVKGTIDENNANAVAERVELDELVKGPATSAAATIATVMGQTVHSSAGTIIDNNCTGVTFDDLSGLTGFFAVEVFGTVRPDGSIDATRIECKLAGEITEFEVNGLVEGLTATTFMINGLEVNYNTANLGNDFPGGQISDGDPVEVKGTDFSAGVAPDPDTLVATRVEYKGNRLDGAVGDHFEIEGFISAFRGVDDFDVRVGLDTFTVVTDPASTTFVGDQNLLGVPVKVEVDGEIDADGNLFASKVEIKTSTNIRVTGLVDPIVGGEIRILNILINTDDTTRFEDKRDDDPNFDAGSVVVGDYIEARGQEMPPGQITAFEVRRDQEDPDTELRGFVEDSGFQKFEQLVILGVTVDATAPGVVYRDVTDASIAADTFWTTVENELAAGRSVLVDVKGTETDTAALQASELQLEME